MDAADYIVWRKGLATGVYTQENYNTWWANFGATAAGAAAGAFSSIAASVPEPTTLILTLALLLTPFALRISRISRRAADALRPPAELFSG